MKNVDVKKSTEKKYWMLRNPILNMENLHIWMGG